MFQGEMGSPPYGLLLEATALLGLWLALGAAQRGRGTPGRNCFVGLCGALMLWCVGSLLVERKLVGSFGGAQLRFAGVLAVAPLWLGLAAHAARLPLARRLPWFPFVLLAPALALLASLHLGAWSDLFVGPRGAAGLGEGPLWSVHLGYAALLGVGGSAVLALQALRPGEPHAARWRLAVAAGALLGLLAQALQLQAGAAGDAAAPMLLAGALVALRVALFHGGLFDVVPVNQRDLIHQLPVGLVLADAAEIVVDVNSAAEEALGIPRAEAVGRTLEAVLRHLPGEVPVEIHPYVEGGRLRASFALIAEARRRDAA
jgi:PAS domain-containing protein